MKKRILSLALALLMALALLPFGALAAEDLSPYADVIEPYYTEGEVPLAEQYTLYGTYYDLTGDKTPELILVAPTDSEDYYVDIYTLSGGKAERIFHEILVPDHFDYRFMSLLKNKDGALHLLLNNQYSPYVGTDEDGTEWYFSSLRNRFFAVNGAKITKYATTERAELRTIPDRDGNYFFIEDESEYRIDGKTVSSEKYYNWLDKYYENYEIFLEISPDDPMDGVPGTQLIAAAKGGFMDVAEKQYYAKPVAWAVEQGITNGTSQVTFSPNDPCTRGQVVTFLWRAAGSPEPASTKNPFKDVKKDAYYYKAVLWAVEKGITKGTSETTFSPGEPCTRGQVVTFLYRNAGTPEISAKNPFKDVAKGAFFYDAVLWAVKNEITNGTSKTTFSPGQTCTRGQIVTFLFRDLAEK